MSYSVNVNKKQDNQLRTQLLNNGQKAVEQNDQLDNINRIGQEAQETGEKTLNELKNQKGQLQRAVGTNKDIAREVHHADKVTTEMRNREFWIKAALWICIVLLFVADVTVLAIRLSNK